VSTVTPRPMPTPDLAGLLAKPPRPTAPTRSEPTSEPAGESEPNAPAAPSETPVPAMTKVAPNSTKPRELKSERPAEATPRRQYLRSIAVYLPRSTHQAVAHKAETTGTSRSALILAAVNATHEYLGPALTDDQPDSGGGELFDIPQRRAPSELTVQTSIRVTDRQLQAIDALVVRHETNRSRLLTAALRLYLKP
jgi:hypothetical protein